MENEKKIKEPFTPENTPNPPQIIDPNKRNDEPVEKEPMKTKSPAAKDSSKREKSKPSDPEKKEKTVGESAPEMNDETTI